MNILLLTNSFLPSIGGRELVVYYMAQSLHEKGHNIRIVGPAGFLRNRKFNFPFPVHRYPRFTKWISGKYGGHSRIWEKELLLQLLFDIHVWDCDIVHAHITYPWGYLAAEIKKRLKKKIIITPHGIDIHTIPALGHGLRLDPVLNKKINSALVTVDATTSISASIKESLLEAGAPKNKIHTIPNGVDLDRFKKKLSINIMEWLGIPQDTKLIVTVGNYHPRKGQAVLIQSMNYILKEEPSAHLVVVGKGTEALLPLIKECNLEGKVSLTGSINFPGLLDSSTPDHLVAIYQSSKLYVSAGIEEGSEGLSLAILEAMAAGLPVVGSDISGNREIIFDGKNGYLVPPSDIKRLADRVICVLKNIDVQKQMSIESSSIAEKYGWHEIVDIYLELYKELLSQ